jgi:hypothetical protein
MAALNITAANVAAGEGAKSLPGVLHETVTQGMPAYRVAATKRLGKADSNVSVALAECVGIFLTAGSAGQPAIVHTEGPITIGAALSVGERYFLGDVAGGIVPSADLSTGEYVTYLGTAISATVLDVKIHNSGVAVP